jgi:hypothetical protein
MTRKSKLKNLRRKLKKKRRKNRMTILLWKDW